MTVAEKIADTERRIAALKLRRDPAQMKPLLRKLQTEAELLEKRLELNLPNDRPPPRWVPLALLGVPVGLVAWLWILGKVVH